MAILLVWVSGFNYRFPPCFGCELNNYILIYNKTKNVFVVFIICRTTKLVLRLGCAPQLTTRKIKWISSAASLQISSPGTSIWISTPMGSDPGHAPAQTQSQPQDTTPSGMTTKTRHVVGLTETITTATGITQETTVTIATPTTNVPTTPIIAPTMGHIMDVAPMTYPVLTHAGGSPQWNHSGLARHLVEAIAPTPSSPCCPLTPTRPRSQYLFPKSPFLNARPYRLIPSHVSVTPTLETLTSLVSLIAFPRWTPNGSLILRTARARTPPSNTGHEWARIKAMDGWRGQTENRDRLSSTPLATQVWVVHIIPNGTIICKMSAYWCLTYQWRRYGIMLLLHIIKN